MEVSSVAIVVRRRSAGQVRRFCARSARVASASVSL